MPKQACQSQPVQLPFAPSYAVQIALMVVTGYLLYSASFPPLYPLSGDRSPPTQGPTSAVPFFLSSLPGGGHGASALVGAPAEGVHSGPHLFAVDRYRGIDVEAEADLSRPDLEDRDFEEVFEAGGSSDDHGLLT